MLSRVADSIYWMSRYVERAENIARFIDVNLRLALDLPPGTGQQWEPLVLITADLPLFNQHYDVPNQANIIALSAACTHMGCIVQWHISDRKFHCPCHGALFTADGAVDKHSALLRSLSPLPRLETRLEQGSIYVKVPVGLH